MTPVGFRSTEHTTLYDPPIDEFSVLLTVLKQGETERYDPIEGPSILIFTELDGEGVGARLSWSQGDEKVSREGQVFFVGAGEEVTVEAKGGRVVAYRASVEAQ
ncbi:hypothetical protein JCM8208_004633 [Rhodotorula glutinis]